MQNTVIGFIMQRTVYNTSALSQEKAHSKIT